MEQSFKGSGVPDVTVLHGSVDVTFNAVITVHLHCQNSNGASDCVASAILLSFLYFSCLYPVSIASDSTTAARNRISQSCDIL